MLVVTFAVISLKSPAIIMYTRMYVQSIIIFLLYSTKEISNKMKSKLKWQLHTDVLNMLALKHDWCCI